MKKLIALLLALGSGLYLGTIGIALDPLPFIDEGVAILVLLNSLAYLGLDLRRFFGLKGAKKKEPTTTIDID